MPDARLPALLGALLFVLASDRSAPAAAPPARLTAEQKQHLDRRDRLSDEVEAYRSRGQWGPAIAAAQEMLVVERRIFGPLHAEIAGSLMRLVDLHERRQDFTGAEGAQQELVKVLMSLYEADNWRVRDARRRVADLKRFLAMEPAQQRRLQERADLHARGLALARQKQFAAAELPLRRSLALCGELLGEAHPDTITIANLLTTILALQGKHGEAESVLAKTLASCRRALGETHPATALTCTNLARRLIARGGHADALPLLEAAVRINREVFGDWNLYTATSHHELADCLRTLKKPAAARPLAENALAIRRHERGEAHPLTVFSLSLLAGLDADERLYDRGQPLFEQALAGARRTLGEHHPTTGQAYGNLAACLRARGQPDRARPLAAKALAILRKALTEAHPLTRASLQDLAETLTDLKRHPEAQRLLVRGLILRRRFLGEGHPETALGYHHLARNLDEQGLQARAQRYHEKALALCRRVRGNWHADTASALFHLALNLHRQARYAEAQPLYAKALAISRRVLGDFQPETATRYGGLANNLFAQGRHAEAQPLFVTALAIRRKVHGERHPLTATSLANLAANLAGQGRYEQAEKLLATALDRCLEAGGERNPDTASVYINRAALFLAQMKYTAAERAARNALRIRQATLGDSHPDTASAVQALAVVLGSQGRYGEAQPLLERALKVQIKGLGENHPALAHTLHIIAANLAALGRSAEAFQAYHRALRNQVNALGAGHPEVATTLHNLAAVYGQQGRHYEARRLFHRALEIRHAAFGEAHPLTANSLHGLADHYSRYNSAEALRLYRRAVASCSQSVGDGHLYTAICGGSLANHLMKRGAYQDAEEPARLATQTLQAARLTFSVRGLERATFALDQQPFWLLAALQARRGDAKAAWDTLEAHLARGLLDDLTIQRRHRPEHRLRLARAVARLVDLDRQITALAKQPRLMATLRRQQEQAQAELAQLQEELEQTYGVIAGKVYSLEKIQQHLPPNAALVAWLDLTWGPALTNVPGEHWACVIRSAGAPAWVRLPGAGEGERWTEEDQALSAQFRRLCGLPPGDVTAKWQATASKLAAQRLAPLEPLLGAHDGLPTVRHLIALPSPAMAGIPIDALTDRYRVSYAPSGTVFAWLQEERLPNAGANSAGLLALSHPDLRGTRPEVETIAALFRQQGGHVETLLGRDACRKSLDRLAGAPGLDRFLYLHLATHGLPDPRGGLRSHLALVPNDRLDAAEILTWKLRADLVTLSACSSALGQHLGGEGYLGFAQPLFLAGARSLVLSQWSVDDTATRLLMERFYRNLLGQRKGLERPLGKALALHEAKQWLRGLSAEEARRLDKEPKGRQRGQPDIHPPAPDEDRPFAHPHYWAGFILVGDPGDLSQDLPVQQAWPWWAHAGLGAALLALGTWLLCAAHSRWRWSRLPRFRYPTLTRFSQSPPG
jgi:CHAT domain-containing protein